MQDCDEIPEVIQDPVVVYRWGKLMLAVRRHGGSTGTMGEHILKAAMRGIRLGAERPKDLADSVLSIIERCEKESG